MTRKRSPHRGVTILRRRLASGISYVAKYRDPDRGREVRETIDKIACPTPKTRRDYCIAISHRIHGRRAEIACGIAPRTETPLATLIRNYLASCAAQGQRASTIRGYTETLRHLGSWADGDGVRIAERLTPAHLARFAEFMKARRRTRQAKGAARRAKLRRAEEGNCSPSTVNHHLRGVSAFLNDARRKGLFPLLSRDTIAESLKRVQVPRIARTALTPTELRAILAAAVRHDGVTWRLTRKQHAQGKAAAPHTVRKFPQIAPLLTFLLLSGCRSQEARTLRWSDVNLDAPGRDGKPCGLVRISASASKTHADRDIDLSVSPGLRTLLAAMKLRAGEDPYVFGGAAPMPEHDARNCYRRMISEFGAPPFTLQRLRQTCGSYLTCAPSIFGAAAAFLSSKQLGHSVVIAERHYVGVIRWISPDARTLDAAMQIEPWIGALTASAQSPGVVASTCVGEVHRAG